MHKKQFTISKVQRVRDLFLAAFIVRNSSPFFLNEKKNYKTSSFCHCSNFNVILPRLQKKSRSTLTTN